MIKIQLDPNGKEKLQGAAQKSLQHGKTAARWLGQSRITAVQAAQAAFGVTHGGIITEAEFDIGKRGSRYEFEILSGGRKYEVNVDAMSGKAWVDED